MIAICIALIALTSALSRTELVEAREQLQLITEALRSWNSDFVNQAAEKRIVEFNSAQRKSLSAKVFLPLPPDANSMVISGHGGATFTSAAIEFRPPNWMVEGPIRQLVPRAHRMAEFSQDVISPFIDQPRLFISGPGNLESFRALWDALASSTKIIVPTKTAQIIYSINVPDDLGTLGSMFRQKTFRFRDSNPATLIGKCTLMLARASSDTDPHLRAVAVALEKPTPYMYVCLEQSATSEISFIPVSEYQEIDFDAQSSLLEKVRAQQLTRREGLLIPHGVFAYSFRALNDVTNNYQNLPLSSFDGIFESELKRTGESFEALGIKFPADETTRWGILLVLAVQLYLWVILRDNATNPNSGDAGCEIAWIGLYPSIGAKAVCFLTTVVLPVLAVVTLGIRALQFGHYLLLYRLLIGVSVSLNITVALMSWKVFPNRKSS